MQLILNTFTGQGFPQPALEFQKKIRYLTVRYRRICNDLKRKIPPGVTTAVKAHEPVYSKMDFTLRGNQRLNRTAIFKGAAISVLRFFTS